MKNQDAEKFVKIVEGKKYDEQETKDFMGKNEKKPWYARLLLLWSIIRHPTFSVPKKAYLLIVGCILYFIMPFDLVPDMIPIIGWSDDIAFMGIVYHVLEGVVQEYEKFIEEENKALEKKDPTLN